jgi:pimeloyl-ACP methyl ester carboxylesterase
VNLLYFGSASRQLFGAYHAPPSTVASRAAALLCAPWGSEYLFSHRAMRRLAVRLSEHGYHVLRFDYFGTGDSAGERDEGDLATWQEDAALALEELRDMSGLPTVATCGIRLGAVVAWRLAAARRDVHATVLWDPVVDGHAYVAELVSAQAMADHQLLTPVRARPHHDRTLDLLGFPLTTGMRQTIEAVIPADFEAATAAQVGLIYSEPTPEQAQLHHALQTAGTVFHPETIGGQPPWREVGATGVGGLPVTALERIVERLG